MTNESDSLLDTNTLLRLTNRNDPSHQAVREGVRKLNQVGGALCITRQNVMEFWSVATRPIEVNGLGLSVGETRAEVDKILSTFVLLPDPPDLLERWLELCTRYEVKGRPSHDARLIAVMEAYNISNLFTLNPGDFKRYAGVTCFTPSDL